MGWKKGSLDPQFTPPYFNSYSIMGEMVSMWAYICYLQVSQFGVVMEDSSW